jgi:dTDP-4-dehydrorhamnose reductase
MKKILILGGGGMLGHKVYQTFSQTHETWVTFRNFGEQLRSLNIFNESNLINNIDVFRIDDVRRVIATVKPDIVINCVGIIKQLKEAKNPKISVYINSLLPHLVSEICQEQSIRFIHISTDCVFSGKRGMYTENDLSDAEDLYGKTKFIVEVNYAP